MTIDLNTLAADLAQIDGCETKRWDDDEYPSYLSVKLQTLDDPRRSVEFDVYENGDVDMDYDTPFPHAAFRMVETIRRHIEIITNSPLTS